MPWYRHPTLEGVVMRFYQQPHLNLRRHSNWPVGFNRLILHPFMLNRLAYQLPQSLPHACTADHIRQLGVHRSPVQELNMP